MVERVVALDVGMKYVGVAVTDPTWNFPVIFGTLMRRDSITDDLFRLREMLDFEVAAITLGYPLRADGSEGSFTPVVRGFERRLKELYPDVPFFRTDEFQSSNEAIEIKKARGRGYEKIKKSGAIDSASAAVILERFMATKEFINLKKERNP
ncbi:Holliday junction resolvase RuvX [bacterium]|nr:Holliday junction resolvase RuvX [bacterium]